MTPKIVDKKEKRNQIIEAAIRVFSKMGFARTKMMEIAKAAGIGKGTIYEYFKSKEELTVAVFNAFVHNIEILLSRRTMKMTDPEEKLHAYFSAWFDIMNNDLLEYGDLMIDIWAESVRLHEGKDIFDLKGMYEKMGARLTEILREGMEQNKFKPMNPDIVSSVILATMDGLFLQWLLDKKSFDIHTAIKQMSEVMIAGLLKTK